MGRPIGSKNGNGSKPTTVTSSKTFMNGRKTSNSSSQKSNSVGGGKINGNASNNNDRVPSSETPGFVDRSQANVPFDIRINGFSSLLNTVKKATSKVKKLIMDECDIILECRVCRSLFRSLPNYLSHKEMYCKNRFHPMADIGYSQFIQNSTNSYEFNYHLDEDLLDSVISSTQSPSPLSNSNIKINKVNHHSSMVNGVGPQSSVSTEVEDPKMSRLHQIISRIAPVIENATRTPSAFYSDIIMRRNNNNTSSVSINSSAASDNNGQTSCGNNSSGRGASSKQIHLNLEPIDSSEPNNGIVFQKRLNYDPSNCCVSNSQEKNKSVINPNTAVLGPDGKIIMCGDSEGIEKIVNRIVAQVEEKHEEQARQLMELNCPHCLTLFPTRKTLRIHARTNCPHVRAAHRSSPDEEPRGGSDSSISVSAAQNSSPNTEETTATTSSVDYPPAKKYKKFHDSTEREVRRETSPDIVDMKSHSTKSYGRISQTIVKSSPPKIMRDVQTLFSSSEKKKRGRPKKAAKLLAKDEMTNGTNHHSHFQSTDLSCDRRLSVSDSSEGGIEESSSQNQKSNTKPAINFRRNLQSPNSVGGYKFKCHKCSDNFSTKSEVTMHQATCAGVINLALLRSSNPSESKKKISILVRHDYLKPNTSGQNTVTNNNVSNIRNSNSSLLGSSSDKTTLEKFNWPRWESQDSMNKKTKQKDNLNNCSNNNNSYNFDARHLSIPNKNNNNFYNTSNTGTLSTSQNRSPFNKFNGYNESYGDQHAHDEEIEDDDMNVDEENDERSTEEHNSNSGDDETSDDDGLPDEDEKNSNHGNTEESDRDSNVTDSGVSTTSVPLLRNEVKS